MRRLSHSRTNTIAPLEPQQAFNMNEVLQHHSQPTTTSLTPRERSLLPSHPPEVYHLRTRSTHQNASSTTSSRPSIFASQVKRAPQTQTSPEFSEPQFYEHYSSSARREVIGPRWTFDNLHRHCRRPRDWTKIVRWPWHLTGLAGPPPRAYLQGYCGAAD